MTDAFGRLNDAERHKEWQDEIDRRDEIINCDKQIIADLYAENAEMREALRPFKENSGIFGNDWMDEDELDVTPGNEDEKYPPYIEGNTLLFTLKVSDFRKARAASPPMKLHFTNEWLKKKIEEDPDDMPETVP